MSCLECLEQTEGRVYDLEGEDCIILARVRRLLCVASMDDWSLLKVLENNAAVLQLEAVVPQGTSWRDFHAFVLLLLSGILEFWTIFCVKMFAFFVCKFLIFFSRLLSAKLFSASKPGTP